MTLVRQGETEERTTLGPCVRCSRENNWSQELQVGYSLSLSLGSMTGFNFPTKEYYLLHRQRRDSCREMMRMAVSSEAMRFRRPGQAQIAVGASESCAQ